MYALVSATVTCALERVLTETLPCDIGITDSPGLNLTDMRLEYQLDPSSRYQIPMTIGRAQPTRGSDAPYSALHCGLGVVWLHSPLAVDSGGRGDNVPVYRKQCNATLISPVRPGPR